MREIAAGEFKATCLKLIDRVAATGEPLEITKRGKTLVRLVPVAADGRELRLSSAQPGTASLYLAPDEKLFSTGEA